jgi:hypothetical protein
MQVPERAFSLAVQGKERSSMLPKLLSDVRFYAFVLAVDLDLALSTRLVGCCVCGGPVHASHFPRKLRGFPEFVGRRFFRRFSFCCGRTGCRKRATPPSVMFLSRKLYGFAVVALIGVMREGITPRRARRLKSAFGVSRETVERWRLYWEERFEEDGEVRLLLGGLAGGARSARALLRRLRQGARSSFSPGKPFHGLLVLLSPLSTGSIDRKLLFRWALGIRRGCLVHAP